MTVCSAQTVGSLYVHVPFCARKCEYCAFYSEPASGQLVDRYVAALLREMQLVADDLKPRTIFFGGKLVFERERWWDRFLHNETAYQIQRRLQFAGLAMVILPVRVLE